MICFAAGPSATKLKGNSTQKLEAQVLPLLRLLAGLYFLLLHLVTVLAGWLNALWQRYSCVQDTQAFWIRSVAHQWLDQCRTTIAFARGLIQSSIMRSSLTIIS